MDRRFFENDNIEDLSQNKSPKNFQKIDEEDEVLKENYIWSDEDYDFSSETDFNERNEYLGSDEEDNLGDDIQVNELEEREREENNSSLEENTVMKVDCQCDDEYSDLEYCETSGDKFNCNYQYCNSDDDTSSSNETSSSDETSSSNERSSDYRDDCDYQYYDSEEDYNCNYQYSDSEEDYECNCSESEPCSSSYKSSRCNDNYSNTFNEDKRYRENKESYLKGKKEGYNAGYEAGARDAIRAAYRAGYKRGLRAAGYRI